MKLSSLFDQIANFARDYTSDFAEVDFVRDDDGHLTFDRHGNVKTFNPNGFWRNLMHAGLTTGPA